MRDRAICFIAAPFDATQRILLAENGELRKIASCSLPGAGKSIAEICMAYGIDKVYLTRSAPYAEKIREDIKTRTNFAKFDIEVEIID